MKLGIADGGSAVFYGNFGNLKKQRCIGKKRHLHRGLHKGQSVGHNSLQCAIRKPFAQPEREQSLLYKTRYARLEQNAPVGLSVWTKSQAAFLDHLLLFNFSTTFAGCLQCQTLLTHRCWLWGQAWQD